jgi:hypothetical protein
MCDVLKCLIGGALDQHTCEWTGNNQPVQLERSASIDPSDRCLSHQSIEPTFPVITGDTNANLIAIPLHLMLLLLSKEPHKKKRNKIKRPEEPAEGAQQKQDPA